MEQIHKFSHLDMKEMPLPITKFVSQGLVAYFVPR